MTLRDVLTHLVGLAALVGFVVGVFGMWRIGR
jgi:hypothetical protein